MAHKSTGCYRVKQGLDAAPALGKPGTDKGVSFPIDELTERHYAVVVGFPRPRSGGCRHGALAIGDIRRRGVHCWVQRVWTTGGWQHG